MTSFRIDPIHVGKKKPKRYAFPPGLNARLHWRRRHEVYEQFKTAVWAAIWAVPQQRATLMQQRARVTITRHAIRAMDTDNLYAGVKPILDGLVRAGVLPDDNTRHVELLVRDERVKHRADEHVTVLVEPLPAA